jgi:hypothetical protein
MVSVCTEQLESFRYFRYFGNPPDTKIEFLIVVTDAKKQGKLGRLFQSH